MVRNLLSSALLTVIRGTLGETPGMVRSLRLTGAGRRGLRAVFLDVVK